MRVTCLSVCVSQTCYTPAQLITIYEAGEVITSAKLTELCPALVYQKLYAQCLTTDTAMKGDAPTTAESELTISTSRASPRDVL